MNIRSIFTEPSKQLHPAYSYGVLVVILWLLAENIRLYLALSPEWPYDRYGGFVVPLTLLFLHLSYQFRWPTFVTVILRVLAYGWVLFGCFYSFYLSRILYPLP